MKRLEIGSMHRHAAKCLERFFEISGEKSADLKVAETLCRDDEVNPTRRLRMRKGKQLGADQDTGFVIVFMHVSEHPTCYGRCAVWQGL